MSNVYEKGMFGLTCSTVHALAAFSYLCYVGPGKPANVDQRFNVMAGSQLGTSDLRCQLFLF